MTAQFNPFTVKISHHAKKRYLERHEDICLDNARKDDYSSAERKMRDTLFLIYTQIPLSKGSHDRKHFKYENDVFVLSKNFDIVVTYYKYENLPKTKVKQIRKTLSV